MKFKAISFLSMVIMFMSAVMVLFSSSVLSLWVSLELNMFSFIPLIKSSSLFNEEESMVKYFIMQSFGSSLMVLSLVSSYVLVTSMDLVVMMAMLVKMGSTPCHQWYVSIMKGMDWFSCALLSTWQKLSPLFILVYYVVSGGVLLIISIANIIIGGIIGIFQMDMRALLGYSSVSHMGWMFCSIPVSVKLVSIVYFFMYCLILIPVFILAKMLNLYKLSNMNKLDGISFGLMLSLCIMMLSLAGVPPLSGFVPKLIVLKFMISESMFIPFIIVLVSMVSLYLYLSVMISFMFFLLKDFKGFVVNKVLFFSIMTTLMYIPALMFI